MKPIFESIVILTGAGVSAESGVATFRGPDGLWEGHRVEDVATPDGEAGNPELVQRFYDARRGRLPAGAAPAGVRRAGRHAGGGSAERGAGRAGAARRPIDRRRPGRPADRRGPA